MHTLHEVASQVQRLQGGEGVLGAPGLRKLPREPRHGQGQGLKLGEDAPEAPLARQAPCQALVEGQVQRSEVREGHRQAPVAGQVPGQVVAGQIPAPSPWLSDLGSDAKALLVFIDADAQHRHRAHLIGD